MKPSILKITKIFSLHCHPRIDLEKPHLDDMVHFFGRTDKNEFCQEFPEGAGDQDLNWKMIPLTMITENDSFDYDN